jgi:mannose-6-phosphate isomerase-like protein (cupin superfamily)
VPTFELLSKQEAQLALMTGKRAEQLKEYVGYIEQRQSDQVGRLIPGDGETTAAIRRRLGAAAEILGRSLEVNRQGNEVYFWEEGDGVVQRRRRRRRAAAAE